MISSRCANIISAAVRSLRSGAAEGWLQARWSCRVQNLLRLHCTSSDSSALASQITLVWLLQSATMPLIKATNDARHRMFRTSLTRFREMAAELQAADERQRANASLIEGGTSKMKRFLRLILVKTSADKAYLEASSLCW